METFMNRLIAALAAGFALMLASPSQAQTPQAQTWPQRTVRFIVPLGPGSGVDLTSRLLAERLQAKWGQSVVIENKPGGDGILAISSFVGAHDDHVLLYSPTSSFTAHPFQHEKLPYDPRDLSPVARVSKTLLGFAVPGSSTIGSVADFMAQVRAQPGKLNYTTATGVTDVIFDGYFKSAGLVITRVPYRDVVTPLTDLGEGRIQAYIGALAIEQPHLQSGRAKLIAITNTERAAAAPGIPTVAEAGFPELNFDGLTGLFGPRDMPNEVRARIAADIRAAMADPVIVSRLVATGQVVSPGGAAELAASIDEQRGSLIAIAKVLGIKPAQVPQ
jgi:tripartite-type tricarboxylate transporter receptor subunit TctC